MIREEKPMRTTEGQIEHLLSKGVKFNIVTVEAATAYLKENNNYFKLRAYRKNFPKHPDGEDAGKYINLDFAMLKDLSIIDMRLRYTLMQMALDIEHFAKVNLLRAVEDSSGDGYQIVEDYINTLKQNDIDNKTRRYETLKSELQRNRCNPYCGGIIAKYDGCYPIWAFTEIIPLGTFIHFYRFCADQFSRKDLKDDYFLLKDTKELRNAAAHSNCILHDLGAKDSKHQANFNLLRALDGISKATKDNQLRNERMRQIITLLYAHTSFVTSSGVHSHTKEMLGDLVQRMYYHIDYYEENDNILTSFLFFKKSVDILFS